MCFSLHERFGCRSLTRKTDVALNLVSDFDFNVEFEVNQIAIPDSMHNHYRATIANYQGFPLAMGGIYSNKLEILNTMKNSPLWIEYEGWEYPYSST